MKKTICSACSNEIEFEVESSQHSIQCPICSEWIKIHGADHQVIEPKTIANLSTHRKSSVAKSVMSGLKSSGFFKGWFRFFITGLTIAFFALALNVFSVLINRKNAEISRQKELIEDLQKELSSLKGSSISNEIKNQSEGVIIDDFKTQVQLYQGKRPDIVEYTGEAQNNTKQKISDCVLIIGFYQYGSNIKLTEEKVEIGTLLAGETARFKKSIKLIDTMLPNSGSGPDSDSGRARVISFKYGSKFDQREIPVAGKIRSDDSKRF
jgi:hypothetical protein